MKLFFKKKIKNFNILKISRFLKIFHVFFFYLWGMQFFLFISYFLLFQILFCLRETKNTFLSKYYH